GGIERGCQYRFALAPGCCEAARPHQSMAEHDDAVLSPDVEMHDPQLLVAQCDQFLYLRQARLRHLHVKSAGKVQRFNVAHPRERHLIIGPSAGDHETDLVCAAPFEWPVFAGSHMLDNVEWAVTMIARRLDECHAVSALSP